MAKEKVTLECGCGCGLDIKPRTPRKLQTDLGRSLSGNLFLNGNHFRRWNYHNQIQLRKEQELEVESQHIWDSLISRNDSTGESMGNLMDMIQDIEPTSPLGGHSAPTNSIFKEKGMTEQEQEIAQLKAQIAKLEAQEAGTTPDAMSLAEATKQRLGNNETGGRTAFDLMLAEKYPLNKVVSMCVNPPIIIGNNMKAWIYLDGQVKMYLSEKELPVCRGADGLWKLDPDGHYLKVTDREDSVFADTHCFCCAVPINDGVRTPDNRPKHWTNVGTMTQHQLAYRWQTYDGEHCVGKTSRAGVPLPNAGWFKGDMDEYIKHAMETHPLGEVSPAGQQPLPTVATESQGQVGADLNDDLPPGF